jgi:hypothetical protein
MELIGASLISVGAGMIFAPAGIIAAGAFILTFAIALERSRAI